MADVTGKVANILKDSELAFNVGSDAGVTKGSFARVQREVAIRDPDSQEELGTVLVTILRLRVHLVDAKFSVGSVTEYQSRDEEAGLLLTQRRYKRIVRSPGDEEPGISVYIKVGDVVSIETSERKS